MSIKIINASEITEDFYKNKAVSADSDSISLNIIKEVIQGGDSTLFRYNKDFDNIEQESLKIATEDIDNAASSLQATKPDLYAALCYSRSLVADFAKRQRDCFCDFQAELTPGLMAGQRVVPVGKAGIYVPAGRFPLLSTVIMTSTPAFVAGVKKIIMCTPPRKHPTKEGKPYADSGIMATAKICGITDIYACGGAQAIAAMAYGTQTIPKVDVIVGPGNKYVASAKKLVSGVVGIDMVAGPTEVFIIADESAKPEWLAADLLAQAEHDSVAQAILVTNSKDIAMKTKDEIDKQLATLQTKDVASQSITGQSFIIVVEDIWQAVDIANRKAPEHLELAMDAGTKRNEIEISLKNYGSLFIGHNAAEVLGDYTAGINHTLPTSGSARFTGGLSVKAFLKILTTLHTNPKEVGYHRSLKAAEVLGQAEGLQAHANAAHIRL